MEERNISVLKYFTDCLHFSQLTPQTAIFGFHNIDNDTFLIQNHILVYSNYIYAIPEYTGFDLSTIFLIKIKKSKT